MKKTLLIASMLTTALAAAPLMAEGKGRDHGCDRERGMKHHAFDMDMGGKMNKKEMLEREFNAEQIRTLMEARLLMKGNDNLKIGKISEAGDGYSVAIVTQDDSLVKELDLAANGMPKEMYEKIQKRMEKRHQDKD